MLRVIHFLILAFGLHATAADVRPAVDITAMQLQYEQILSQKIQNHLDPLLGQKNYSLSVRLTTTRPSVDSTREMFFAKLGMSAQLPETDFMATYSFSDWIKSVDITIAYADNIQNIDDSKIKEDVSKIIKSLGKVKINVELSKFTTIKTPTNWRENWTPFSIFILGVLICLTLYWSFLKLSTAIEKSGASSGRASSLMDMPTSTSAGTATEIRTSGVGTAHNPNVNQEGLKKWLDWLTDYPEPAQHYLEKLARSEQKGDKYVLAYIVQNTNLKKLTPVLKSLKKELHAEFKEAAALLIEKQHLIEIDEHLLQNVTQSFIEVQTDADNILKMIHDFTVEECVLAAEQDPQLLNVFMRHFSSPHMEQILNRISHNTFVRFTNVGQSPKGTPLESITRMRNHILSKRELRDQKDSGHFHKWLVVASHLDTDRERELYKTICSNPDGLDEIQKFADDYFPQFLVADLPDSILKPVLNSLPYKERAELLFTTSDLFRSKLASFYKNEPKAQELLEYETKSIEEDSTRKTELQRHASSIHKNFYARLRKYIASSPNHKTVASSVFKNWIKMEAAHAHTKTAA